MIAASLTPRWLLNKETTDGEIAKDLREGRKGGLEGPAGRPLRPSVKNSGGISAVAARSQAREVTKAVGRGVCCDQPQT